MASQKVHGITIDLDVNTSAVNEAFKDINKSLVSTQKELNQVDKLLKIDPKNTTLLAQKQYLLSDAIEDTKSKLNQLAKAKLEADKSGDVDKSSKQYRELERDIIKTKESLSKLTDQYEDNEKAIKNVNKNTDDLGKNLKDASKNALSFGDILKANVVSDFIVDGVKSLAQSFVDIGKAMYDSVREAGAFADDVNTLAKQYNLSTKEIQQFIRASDLVDVDLETISKSIVKLTKNMTSNSSGVINAFKKLGIATKDSKGNLRDSNEVFYETIDALSKVENATLQDSLALEIFGKSSAELGTLINGGAEELNKFNKYLEDNNLLLSQEELDNLNEMNDSFDMLKATFESIKTKIASELAPVIKPLVEELTNFIVDHKDSIVELVKELIERFTSGDGQKMFDNFTQLVQDIGDFIDDTPRMVDALETLAKPIELIADLIGAIVSGLKWLNNANTKDIEFRLSNLKDGATSFSPIMHSKGFGALNSGGFNSTINATFTINNQGQPIAKELAYQMVDILNEELGKQF